MDRQQLYRIMNEYFSISQEEVDKALAKGKIDEYRLQFMLEAIIDPYCKKWVYKKDENGKLLVDEKLKCKAGKVFLDKLDYDSFAEWENSYRTFSRLKKLFFQMDKKGINPYKIIYCTVLTDGNLVRGSATGDTRDFEEIYGTVASLLATDNKETNAIFEKCGATLIGKCYTFKMEEVFNEIARSAIIVPVKIDGNLSFRNIKIFSHNEVQEILKNAPSLFDSTGDTIKSSFEYIDNKIKSTFTDSENMQAWEKRIQALRAIFKNNASLFKLNVFELNKKEKILKQADNIYDAKSNKFLRVRKISQSYDHAILNLFSDPTNLSLMNVIKTEDIAANAVANVKTLEKYFSVEQVCQYIQDNAFVLAMSKSKLSNLLESIKERNGENPEQDYMTQFLELGRSLFKNTSIIEEEKVIGKLQKGAIMDIDVDKIKPEDCLEKFVAIFCVDDSIQYEILNLIFRKEKLDEGGDKEVRRNIREVGKDVANIPAILKNKEISVKEKKYKIVKLYYDICAIRNSRLKLADTQDIFEAQNFEKNNSEHIENALNELRDIYNQKRFHVAKRYTNTDKLFEKMMTYLGEVFDDKKAISELFDDEVSRPFTEGLKSIGTRKNDNLFGSNFEVPVQAGLKESLRDVRDILLREQQYGEGVDNIEFVTEKNGEKSKE